MHKAVPIADEDTAGDRQVSVKPGVPQAAAIRLHINCQEAGLDPLGVRLQLQTGAATQHTMTFFHSAIRFTSSIIIEIELNLCHSVRKWIPGPKRKRL